MDDNFPVFLFHRIKMAILYGLFSCFLDSSRVAVEGNPREAENINGDDEAKSNSRKSAEIPVAYFPVGSKHSCL